MKTVSILNHVLGPVMRGPSSSHTAGAFHIASMARSMVGGTPRRAMFAFDPTGSYAATYVQQGADRGFAMGLMGKSLTEDSFFTAISDAAREGLDICFELHSLDNPNHPNTVEIELTSQNGDVLRLVARSIGGGEVEITQINDHPVRFNGTAWETLIEAPLNQGEGVCALLGSDGALLESPVMVPFDPRVRLTARRTTQLSAEQRHDLQILDNSVRIWESEPVYFVQSGQPLFASAARMVQLTSEQNLSLGQLALAYEAQLLGIPKMDVIQEMLRRYDIMAHSVDQGLDPKFSGLQWLPACAGAIFQAESAGKLSFHSPHTRAAARALAVMHVDGAMGVVCAAPTGGSAGVIPGTIVTLAEERKLSREPIALALLASGAIGLIVAQRATFAAEVAGCQVEIGASGAMAAAAVVEALGGSAQQACDAAAISFQNTMGSVCDLLQGSVEIPCHTRNAGAAASAFVNADMILGGYVNRIPLDETIDAVYAVGLGMPSELRCTSKGGLSVAPSALSLKPCCPSHRSDCL